MAALPNVLHIRCFRDEVSPSITECGCIRSASILVLHTKICIDSENQTIFPSNGHQCLKPQMCATYLSFLDAVSHSGGIFRSGCGQAGHSTAHSPGLVPSTPSSSCPLPPLFRSFKCSQIRIARKNASYRSFARLAWVIQKKRFPYLGRVKPCIIGVTRD